MYSNFKYGLIWFYELDLSLESRYIFWLFVDDVYEKVKFMVYWNFIKWRNEKNYFKSTFKIWSKWLWRYVKNIKSNVRYKNKIWINWRWKELLLTNLKIKKYAEKWNLEECWNKRKTKHFNKKQNFSRYSFLRNERSNPVPQSN